MFTEDFNTGMLTKKGGARGFQVSADHAADDNTGSYPPLWVVLLAYSPWFVGMGGLIVYSTFFK